ncbi:MAG: SH3 domain-containing protein [Chloroflexota bacterium]
MTKPLPLLTLLSLLLASCGTATPAPTEEAFATPSATSTPSLSPTETPTFPTPTFTLVLIPGTLTTQVNVRSGPGTTYESLGLLDTDETVQVNLQNETGAWYRILYPAAPDGFGWVAAQYVSLPEGSEVPRDVTPTPAGPTGRVLIRLNVRSGPGTTFETLGMLEADTIVVLAAKNATASWFQIEYPPGSEERGWVTAQYVQTDYSADLPVVDEFGQPVSTGTPGATPVPMTPTPTIGPAVEDGDSSTNPAVSILFSSGGTRKFTYSSQVSAPGGDAADWVEFTPFASLPGADARLLVTLVCAGNGTVDVELWQEGTPLPAWGTLACGDRDRVLTLPAGIVYQFRLSVANGDDLRLVQYSLTVDNLP